jgi:capping protein (actin filament) muscle Z-line, alpha
LDNAFKKYNEEQLTTVKLPGGSRTVSGTCLDSKPSHWNASYSCALQVLISEYNSLEEDRYYDVDASSSFSFDHKAQKASDVKSHILESKNKDTMYAMHIGIITVSGVLT